MTYSYRALARRVAACLPLIAIGLSVQATAQTATVVETETSADDHGDIVVLGTKSSRNDTLGSDLITRRMSQSSRSLERDLLVAAGTYRLSDALELFSGISQQNNRGGFLDNFAIRGFLGTPDGGAEYYVDGFLANRGLAPPRDPATTERIEVLKGPAGAVFGDIDPAGRVNIVSKTPRFTPHAEVTLLYGSFDNRRAEVDVTGPLSATLAGRIVVAAEDSDGYRDFVGLSRRVVSPSLTWEPQKGTRLTALAEYTRFDSAFDRGVPALNNDALALPRTRFYGEPSDGDHRARNTRLQLTGEQALGGEWSLNGGIIWRRSTLRGFSSDQSRLVGTRTLWRQRRERGYESEDLSARLELAGRFDALGVHHPSLGVKGYTLDYLELLRRRNPTAAFPYAIDVFDPVYGGVAQPLLPSIDQRETRRAATVYLQDMWDVTDRLTLTGGIRYDAYRQRLRRNLTGIVSQTSDEPVRFRAGARYRVTDTVAVHANWGESFLLNSGTGRPPAADQPGQPFGPEQAKGYELGIAGRWPGIDIAATFFDIEKRGILTNDPIDAGFLAPVGSLTSRGVELDASMKLLRRWQLVANYAYIDARADDASFATPAVLNVAKHSGTLLVVGRYPTGWGTEWSVTGGVAHVGDRAGAIDTSGLRLPAYTKVKLSGEIGVTPALTLRAEADNLFDTHYAMSSYSPVWVFPGAPRTVRVSARMTW
ncbi:TonB-dependent siderophore receptor [Sphingomonas mollis]|uniref:TonB-dependent siderophore receptor n=1 Tax=Sphingomonas mollis TaxID=2795726 RepID=A0ABS0XTM3_9SPHN|nr:TonB-dependent siderophore receptor [Sphingomonas sp. BT553]MBJ6123386.1 TonB-dependent siderophore receptor [Sphingomonas sp. BT553]